MFLKEDENLHSAYLSFSLKRLFLNIHDLDADFDFITKNFHHLKAVYMKMNDC